jgi:hypothetical protein
MFVQSKKQCVITLLVMLAAAFPVTSFATACKSASGKAGILKVIGGYSLCYVTTGNGVDETIFPVDTTHVTFGVVDYPFDLTGNVLTGYNLPTWSQMKITSFDLTTKPTSPSACGTTRDDDCDDMKQVEIATHNGAITTSSTISTTTPATVQLASGVVACYIPPFTPSTNPSQLLSSNVINVLVPYENIIGHFSGSQVIDPTILNTSNPVTITSTAVDNPDSENFARLQQVCENDPAVKAANTTSPHISSVPADFLPCSSKEKVTASRSGKVANKSVLSCTLPIQECTVPGFTQIDWNNPLPTLALYAGIYFESQYTSTGTPQLGLWYDGIPTYFPAATYDCK